jgi:hypothetical protein
MRFFLIATTKTIQIAGFNQRLHENPSVHLSKIRLKDVTKVEICR